MWQREKKETPNSYVGAFSCFCNRVAFCVDFYLFIITSAAAAAEEEKYNENSVESHK